MFQEWGLALRAGVMVTPSTLVYGKVGYVRDEQRKEFVPFDPGTSTNVGGASTPGYYYDHFHATGIQWGGGIEQLVLSNVYVKAEGRYSNYKRHTHAITGLMGLGVLFGPTRRSGSASSAAPAAASAAASGDADVPGWQRDPGDRRLPGSAASASPAAASGAAWRTRLTRTKSVSLWGGPSGPPHFFAAVR